MKCVSEKLRICTKIILLVTLFFGGICAYANVWDAIKDCATDPCNCGESDKTRWEEWNGQRINKGPKNSSCPPWHKENGRDNNTCLVQSPMPRAWTLYYENLCAEAVPDSNYLTPKIRVRGQQCNALECWHTSTTLNWNGECVTLASGYIFPLHRMCARVAVPADPIHNIPADPGYTQGKHLNFEGATEDDELVATSDGQKIMLSSPKLCLYKDPSILSLDNFDVMDFNPHKQPMHKTKETHPIVKVIIFIVDNVAKFGSGVTSLLSSLFGILDNSQEGQITSAGILREVLVFVSKIIEILGDGIISLLKEVGQINRTVDDRIYGCVNLPLGPYPPPYCNSIELTPQVATTQAICPLGEDGVPIASIDPGKCVVSTMRNNYINNSIRVSYDNFVPLCRHDEDSMLTDTCVTIDNIDSFANPSVLHISTARRDIILPCDQAPKGATCVRTKIPHKCSVSNDGCQDGFRIVYGTKIGDNGTITPSDYYRDDIKDCPSSTGGVCQKIWGINTGEFIDINLKFDPIQKNDDLLPLRKNFTLQDSIGRATSLYATIVKVDTFDRNLSFMQKSNQICVFESSNELNDQKVIGCVARAPEPYITVNQCDDSTASSLGISCISSYYNPRFIVSYKAHYKNNADGAMSEDIISTLIEPATVYKDSNNNRIINFAGKEFQSFVTDEQFTMKPFTGINAPNPTSIFGKYLSDVPPVVDNRVNPYAIYLEGLEYVNDKYRVGGKYACLTPMNSLKCPDNPKLCVLTKLLNNDTILCSTFNDKIRQYGSFSLCTAEQNKYCNRIDSIATIDGKSEVIMRSCSDTGAKCYDNPVELCTPSLDVVDRVKPDASLGPVLQDDQYYDDVVVRTVGLQLSAAKKYDDNIHGLRNKTPIEQNLCVQIPQGVCQASNGYLSQDGYAAWPETPLGQIAQGSCKPGWSPIQPLLRKCIAQPDTLPRPDAYSFGFEPLYKLEFDKNKNRFVIRDIDFGCRKDSDH